MANTLDPMDLKQIITLHLDGVSNRKIGILPQPAQLLPSKLSVQEMGLCPVVVFSLPGEWRHCFFS